MWNELWEVLNRNAWEAQLLSLPEIGNVNTVEHINVHTDFHVFFLASILNSVCFTMSKGELLEYTVSKESSFRFQDISVSAFCLLCNHISGFHVLVAF